MTVTTTANKTVWQGNGATTVFSYSFPIPTTASVVLTYTDASGNQSVLTPSQYTITGVGGSGGTVTYPTSGSPIAAGTSLTLQRILPYTQPESLANQGGLWPTAIEQGGLDNLEYQIQQLAEQTARALLFNVADVGPFGTLPTATVRANQLLGFDANGNPAVALPTSALVSAAMQPVVDAATRDAAVNLLTYTAGLTSATSRTLSGKLEDFVSVLDFGADSSGTADSTTAIQAALNDALNVYLPAGTYKTSSPLTMRAGQKIWGAGRSATRINYTGASGSAISFVASSLTLANVTVRDMSISGNGQTGVAFTLISDTVISNVEFLGCSTSALQIDRGYYHLIDNCASRPLSPNKAGPFSCISSSTTDYCFYPALRNCKVHTEDELGVSVGVNTQCVTFHRTIGGLILHFVGERLNLPTADTVAGIALENDCQGTKIIGGVTYGATYGVYMSQATGPNVGPGYTDIIGHDVDYFTRGGIYLAGSATATIADTTIVGGKITAARSSTIPYIYVGHALKTNINSVVMDDYTASNLGAGIDIDNNAVTIITNCVFSYLAIGLGIVAAPSQVYMTNCSVTNTTTPISGANLLIGSVSRISGNRGLGAIELGATTTPAVPVSGGTVANDRGYDVMIYVSGGTGVTSSVGPTNLGANSGPFYVSANNTISLTYSAAPTWTWVGV